MKRRLLTVDAAEQYPFKTVKEFILFSQLGQSLQLRSFFAHLQT
jgi:hypothetical protein